MNYFFLISILFATALSAFSSEQEDICAAGLFSKYYSMQSNAFQDSLSFIIDKSKDKHSEDKITDLQTKLKIHFDLEYCHSAKKKNERSEVFSDIESIHRDFNANYKNCLKSKEPLKYISNELELSNRFIKNYRELEVEINERFFEDENSNCNIAPFFKSLIDEYKGADKIKRCEDLLIRFNKIRMAIHKCKPKT